MGTPVAKRVMVEPDSLEEKKILLICSGKAKRYWAHFSEVVRETPQKKYIPEYYRHMVGKFKTWFKITEFESAPKNIMSKCVVISSGVTLGDSSKHSMSLYFIIRYEDGGA